LGVTDLFATTVTVDVWAILFCEVSVAYELRGASVRNGAQRLVGKWRREDMVRGEGERRFDRRLHVYATCSHPIPVKTAFQPSPLSSPSNEQAHHMSMDAACRYDCEQRGAATYFSFRLKINHREDRGLMTALRAIMVSSIFNPRSSVFVICFGTRVPLRTSGGRSYSG
jgi:hypothetical protein